MNRLWDLLSTAMTEECEVSWIKLTLFIAHVFTCLLSENKFGQRSFLNCSQHDMKTVHGNVMVITLCRKYSVDETLIKSQIQNAWPQFYDLLTWSHNYERPPRFPLQHKHLD